MIKSYEELPVGKYDELVQLTLKATSETQCRLKVVSILSGFSVQFLKTMPISRFTQLAKQASFVETKPKIGKHIRSEYNCGGYCLVPTKDLRDLTTAQYVDFEELTKQKGDHAVEILSVFLVPKGKKYCDGYDPQNVQAAIRDNLSVLDAIALTNFFTKRWQRSITNSLTSSVKIARRLRKGRLTPEKKAILEVKMQETREVLALLRSGDGFPLLTRWLLLYALTGTLSGR